MRWAKAATISLLVLPVLVAIPSRAYACSCAPQPRLGKAIDQTDVVFSGVPVASRMTFYGGQNGAPRSIYWVFDVVHRIKGDVADGHEVRTHAQGGASCGFTFRSGSSYLVFGDETESGAIETSTCTNTRLLDAKAETVLPPPGKVNDGYDPQAFRGLSSAPEEPRESLVFIALVALASFLAVSLGAAYLVGVRRGFRKA